MLSPCCCLHTASVYLLNVFRMIRCLGLVFGGGEGGEWRPRGKGIFSKSGLAIFRTESGREQIALLSTNHFTSAFFQQCNQASSCFGAGTWALSRAESSPWVWRNTFFFLFLKITHIYQVATFKLVYICKCWRLFNSILWKLSSPSVFQLEWAWNHKSCCPPFIQ